MTYRDLQNLDYHPDLPVEFVLTDLLYKGKLDVNTVLSSYTKAIEMERTLSKSKFEEACVNIFQLLAKKKNGVDKDEDVEKRAVHTLNLSDSIRPHIYDGDFGYTDQDEKKWDEFTETVYGMSFQKQK